MYRILVGPSGGFDDVFSPLSAAPGSTLSGAMNSFSRANKFLPGDWTHLGAGDLDRIYRVMGQHMATDVRPSLSTIEACLMIDAILSTGRTLEDIYPLSFRRFSPRTSKIEDQDVGLLRADEKWTWWLPAPGPERKTLETPELMVPVVPNAWLPVSNRFDHILAMRLERRPHRNWEQSGSLFTKSKEEIRARVQAILASSPRGSGIPRRSASTVNAAERWMLSAMLHQRGGDLATASVVTSRANSAARAMTYYGSVPVDRAIAAHRATLKRLGEVSDNHVPAQLADKAIGELATPTDQAVLRLTDALQEQLRLPNSDLARKHEAMTHYTFALLSFAAALRGGGVIPGARGVDDLTGFASVADKSAHRPGRKRLVWLCDLARQQLENYERHLDLLTNELGIKAREDLKRIRDQAGERLPLIKVHDRYRIERLDFEQLHAALRSVGWPGRTNAGRHWIRAKLAGQCSHETLSAFLGHWRLGTEHWGRTSSLDPLLYRADLERVLDKTLARVGWRPQTSPFMKSTAKASGHQVVKVGGIGSPQEKWALLLTQVAPRPGMTPEERAGQLLASAVFNGAFLDRKWWSRWLEAAFRGPVRADELVWLELEPLDPDGGGPLSQGRRWFPDPVTRTLLGNWHGRGGLPTSACAEDCLSKYLTGRVGDNAAIDLLIKTASRRWRLHMPPLLVAHAKGEVRAVPVASNDWHRILGLEYREEQLPEPPRRGAGIRAWAAGEIKAIETVVEHYKKGPRHQLDAKTKAARNLRQINTLSPAQALLNQWCVDALTYDRGRQQRGLAPSTVQNYLGSLCRHIISEHDDLLAMSAKDLVDFFDMKLAAIPGSSARGTALKGVRSLYYTLEKQRADLGAFPALLEDYRNDERASANLISPQEYEAVLRTCRNDSQRLCMILGFRCGLRFDEITGLTVHDFYLARGLIELTIIRNEHRNLKTPKSRRVLPLGVFLERSEAEFVRDFVARRTKEFLAAKGKPLIVQKDTLSEGFDGSGNAEKALGRLLFSVTRVPCRFHHLRHSFASYLLATLLLPDGCPERAVPAALRSVISLRRKSRIADKLLGEEKLGQHSLHALSQAMGHIVPFTTTGWYCHLLDLSVYQYVSRPIAEALLPQDEVLWLTGRSRPNRSPSPDDQDDELRHSWRPTSYRRPFLTWDPLDTVPPGLLRVSSQLGERTRRWEKNYSNPKPRKFEPSQSALSVSASDASRDWRSIKAAIEAADHDDALEIHPKAARWRASAKHIRALMQKSGVPRHRFDQHGHARLPKWIAYVDVRWPADVSLAEKERRSLFFVIENWDPSRNGARFRDLSLAAHLYQFLARLGFAEDEIKPRGSGIWGEGHSSSDLRGRLSTNESLSHRSGRKKRGAIGLYFVESENSDRKARSGAYFLLLMLGIREGYGLTDKH